MKYLNDGWYNEEVIFSWCRFFCEDVKGIQFEEDRIYSREFIGFILDTSEELATKRGAKKFLKENREIYNSENYNQNTADHLFKTFCYILFEIERKNYYNN